VSTHDKLAAVSDVYANATVDGTPGACVNVVNVNVFDPIVAVPNVAPAACDPEKVTDFVPFALCATVSLPDAISTNPPTGTLE
jgi:hypothetical protein